MKQYEGRLLTGILCRVGVENNRICSVEQLPESKAQTPRLLPWLVDLQQNGALGHCFDEIDNAGPLREIKDYLEKKGVGRIFATFCTSPKELMLENARKFGEALDNDPELDRFYAGIFHEGLFMSPEEGWRGAHNPALIEPPDIEYLLAFHKASGNRLRLVNLGAEVPGAAACAQKLRAVGINVSIGHCNPTPEQIRALAPAFVTHLGNGAPAKVPRFANPYWEYLSNDELTAGVICDGFHVPPELVRVAAKCKKYWYAVSDASGLSGLPAGDYEDGGLPVAVDPRGVVVLRGTQLLAGAWQQQDTSVNFLHRKVGLSFDEAWARCSTIPAGFFKLALPEIKVGDPAEFLVVDDSTENWTLLEAVGR